jgi:quinol monooxygenase YgiN
MPDCRTSPRMTRSPTAVTVGTGGNTYIVRPLSNHVVKPSIYNRIRWGQINSTKGAKIMNQYAASKQTVGEAVGGGGLLVVAQWEAKEGQADKVAGILDRFLPEAQRDPGTKLFLIGRGKENPAHFLFYELFVDEAAFKAHQESAYFKTFIAGQALPLLAKRERTQYALL